MSQKDRTDRQVEPDSATSLSLLNLAKERDEDAWRLVVEKYGPRVETWCRQSGVPPHEVMDVVQDVLLSVLRSLEKFHRDQEGDGFRKWLRKITASKVSDHRRQRRKEPPPRGGSANWFVIDSAKAPLPDPVSSTAVAIGASNEVVAAVRKQVQPKTWEAFWRTAIEDQDPADVAADLEMSIASVYKARSRVLSRLRQAGGGASEIEPC
jgi:RNA polymerase sigma-70 factor (ECF subfamily)